MITIDKTQNIPGLALAVGQTVAPYVYKIAGLGSPETKDAQKFSGPVTPAPATFAIWAPLFLCGLAYALRGRIDPQKNVPDANVTRYANATFLQNILWSLNSQFFGLGWQSVALISGAAISGVATTVGARRRLDKWTEKTFAPLAGWLTLATFANLETTLNKTFGRPGQQKGNMRSAMILMAAIGTVAVVNEKYRIDKLYNLSVAVGLAGIIAKNVKERKYGIAAAGFVGLTVLGFLIFRKRARL